jgi:hypothetical protein
MIGHQCGESLLPNWENDGVVFQIKPRKIHYDHELVENIIFYTGNFSTPE